MRLESRGVGEPPLEVVDKAVDDAGRFAQRARATGAHERERAQRVARGCEVPLRRLVRPVEAPFPMD